MNQKALKEAFSEKTFVQSLFALDTVTEVQEALKDKGVDLSEEDILSIHTLLAKVESGEISLEQLETGDLPEELLGEIAGGSMLISMGIVAACGLIGIGLSDAVTRGW